MVRTGVAFLTEEDGKVKSSIAEAEVGEYSCKDIRISSQVSCKVYQK